MDHVLKVLLQFCKDYFGEYAPSKKGIHALISRLEREGEVKAPHEILDHRSWDDLTSEFAQHIMSAQEGGSELKTWGLILRGGVESGQSGGKGTGRGSIPFGSRRWRRDTGPSGVRWGLRSSFLKGPRGDGAANDRWRDGAG